MRMMNGDDETHEDCIKQTHIPSEVNGGDSNNNNHYSAPLEEASPRSESSGLPHDSTLTTNLILAQQHLILALLE